MILTVRLTETEWNELERRARSAELSISDYVRQALGLDVLKAAHLERRPTAKVAVAKRRGVRKRKATAKAR